MHFLSIIWNPNDTLFALGPLQIKYYNLLWIAAFAIGWFIMKRIFTNEKRSIEELDSLFIYTVLATMLGARLGHVVFYQPELITQDPLSILLPIKTVPEFKFTGFTGLASHGAAIGIIIAMFLYVRKYAQTNILWILDRLVIPSAIGAFCVRLGNFFNSEIVGSKTQESFLFATKFIRNTVGSSVDTGDLKVGEALRLTGAKSANNAYELIEKSPKFAERLAEIPYRHPAQLYEGVAYIGVFLILYYFYWKTDKKNKSGFLFGTFLVLLWGIRFFVEFVKERQNELDASIGTLSIGQLLSIPFILIGLYFMFRPKPAK